MSIGDHSRIISPRELKFVTDDGDPSGALADRRSRRQKLDKTMNEMEKGKGDDKGHDNDKGGGKGNGEDKGKGKGKGHDSPSSPSQGAGGLSPMKGAGGKGGKDGKASPVNGASGNVDAAENTSPMKGPGHRDGSAIMQTDDVSSVASPKKKVKKKAASPSFHFILNDGAEGEEFPRGSDVDSDLRSFGDTPTSSKTSPAKLTPMSKKKNLASGADVAPPRVLLSAPPDEPGSSSLSATPDASASARDSRLPSVRGSASTGARGSAATRGSATRLRGRASASARGSGSPNELMSESPAQGKTVKGPKCARLFGRKKPAPKKKTSKALSAQPKPECDDGGSLQDLAEQRSKSLALDESRDSEEVDRSGTASVKIWLERSRINAALREAEESLRKPSKKSNMNPKRDFDTLTMAGEELSPRRGDEAAEDAFRPSIIPME
eukprot:GEMP01023543.1.p1 GENE.GEMP01023543.1~~GEMP01023543.1.p1  ORF type:complete len:437 (+),score=111.29 GEMP01023543.1:323-1633(+)